MTESEIEDFPSCRECIFYIRYKCTNEPTEDDEPLDLMNCHRDKDDKTDFMNHKFDRWWVKNLRSPN